MASVTALPGAVTEHRGLDHWMRRVLAELAKLRDSPDKDTVHDLRVAIRRCRSVGAVMAEVDPNPLWREMRHLPRKLFRRLGALRDAQIMGDWVKAHGAENDKLRLLLEEHFAAQEPALLKDATRAAEKFDQRTWKRLDRKLRKRVRLVAPQSLAAECLALERLEEAKELHKNAVREQRPESWHALRIGVKKFRYTVECLLPERYQTWSNDLKHIQDTLGEIHDLDVLLALMHEKADGTVPELLSEWERRIERERNRCLDQYSELAMGKTSTWNTWSDALPQGQRANAAGMARIRATARAAEAHPRRAAQVQGISMAIFDAFRSARVTPIFRDRASRRALRAAARLSGLNGKRGELSRKELRRFLLGQPAPPGWTRENWEVLAWTLRYHRGAEPDGSRGGLARLTEEQQQNLRAGAGAGPVEVTRGFSPHPKSSRSGIGVTPEGAGPSAFRSVPTRIDQAQNQDETGNYPGCGLS